MKKLFFTSITAIFFAANLFGQGLDFTATPVSGTFPLTVTFTNASSNQSAYKYIWYFGDGAVVTDYNTTTINHTYTSAGTFTPNFDAYDSSNVLINYTYGSSGNIFVLNPLTVSVSSSNAYCHGIPDGTATATASGGDGQYSYSWFPGSQTTQSVSGLSPGTYIVTVTDLSASQTSDTVFITEPTALNVTAISSDISCFGSTNGAASATVTGGTPTGGSPGYSFSWTPYLGPMSYEPNITGLPSGIYSVVVTDANGCNDTAATTVSQPVSPISFSANNSVSICMGQSITLGFSTPNGGTPGYTYSWSPSTGLSCTTCLNPDASPSTTTIYTATVTDVNYCTASVTQTITVNPLPNATATASPNPACDGASVAFNAGGGLSYTWSGPNGFSSAIQNPNLIATGAAAGSYFCAVTDANNCTVSDTLFVTVNPVPTVTVPSNSTQCAGTTINVPAFSSSLGGVNFIWTNSDTTIGLTSNGTGNIISFTGTNTTANPITASIAVTGTLAGCTSNQSTFSISINPSPVVSASVSPAAVCEGAPFALIASSIAGGTYSWSGPNGFASSMQNPTISGTLAASGIYTLTATANGCFSNSTVEATVNPNPTITISGAQNICNGDSASISTSAYGGTPGYSFLWNTGSSALTIIVNPNTTTNYSVTCSDINGCLSSAGSTVNVNVNTDIYGTVSYSGGALTSGGSAVLLHQSLFNVSFDTTQVSTIDAAGNYHFTLVNRGDYLIKIFADTIAYPLLTPTYYGNEWAWDSATVITHGCNLNDTATILMLEETGTGGGLGVIQGQIVEGVGFGRAEGGPIPGVDVKLGRNPGGIVASFTTDNNGYYSFTDVSDGSYTIFVDIPGLGTDSSYTVEVDATTNQYINLDYSVDSTTIHYVPNASVGISNPSMAAGNKFNVYPNPFKGNASIVYSIGNESSVSLEVYNVLGRKIKTISKGNQKAGDYKYSLNDQSNNLQSGIYFITLGIDGKSSTQRVVVLE